MVLTAIVCENITQTAKTIVSIISAIFVRLPYTALSISSQVLSAVSTGAKSHIIILAKQGKYTASIAAYGYIAGTYENRTPIIDENTAPNVRRMFEMRAQGASPTKNLKKPYFCKPPIFGIKP